MGLKDRSQPSPPRFFPGQRWLNIGLRALHLLGVAGTGAALLVPVAADGPWRHYLMLTLATGVAMSLIDAWSDRRWLLQLSGQAVLLKLLLLGLIPLWPAAGPVLLAVVIILSAVVSHAPAGVRHYSFLQGRSLERPPPRCPGR
jgi:hypothetical protein